MYPSLVVLIPVSALLAFLTYMGARLTFNMLADSENDWIDRAMSVMFCGTFGLGFPVLFDWFIICQWMKAFA